MSRPSKLSDENIKKIIELSKTLTNTQLAEMFCIDRTTIYYHLERAKIINWPSRRKIKQKTSGIKRKIGRGLNAGKSYRELLEIENEKRKKAGLWLYKPSKNKL